MPGSPPSSTSEPGTMPPPSTRSNSLMPVLSRSATTVSTSAYSCALPPPSGCDRARASLPCTGVSGRLFDERIPCAAVGTAAEPFRRLRAAGLAGKDRFTVVSCHRVNFETSNFEVVLVAVRSILAAEPADHFPRNRADRPPAISRAVISLVALPADDDDLVAGRDVEPGDVDHDHVHAHGADDRHALAADEHRRAAGQARVEAVGVAGGNDRDRARPVRLPAQPVARCLRRPAGPSPPRYGW